MNVKNVQVLSLVAVAIVLVVVSVIGLENTIFKSRVDLNAFKKPYTSIAEGGVRAGGEVTKRLPAPWNRAFVIAERIGVDLSGIVAPKQVSDDEAPVARDDLEYVTLKVKGIMRGSNNRYQAIINRSLVNEGGMVSGCLVRAITADYVDLDAHGESKRLFLNEEIRFRRHAFQDLVLEEIVQQGSVRKAKINGYVYRAGDEIDSATRVRAVTPSEVRVMRAGTMMVLHVDK